MVFWSKNGANVQGAYRTNRKFRSERKKNVTDDACDDIETDDSADTESLGRHVSSSDLNSKSEEASGATAQKAILVPSNYRDKQKSINVNESHRSYAHARARLLENTASRLGVKLTGKFHACSRYSQAKGVRYSVRKKASVPAS